MKKILAALLLIPSLSFAEEQSKWNIFTKMPDGIVWEYKKGSLDVIKGANEDLYWVVQFRTHKDGNTSYDFVKIAVSLNDCKRESGQVVIVDMTNTEKARADFVFDGGTLASNIAQTICRNGNAVLEKVQEQKNEPPKYQT